MNAQRVHDYLQTVEDPPSDPTGLSNWLEASDALRFLANIHCGHIPVCFIRRDFFVYGVLIPANRIPLEPEDELLGWNHAVSSGWTYMPHQTNDSIDVTIHSPNHIIGSSLLEDADPMIYSRRFARRVPEHYFEVNQVITHLAEVHWLAERNAYCRLDEYGDIVESIKVFPDHPDALCTFDAQTLEKYLAVTGQILVLLFDIHRIRDWDRFRSYQGKDAESTTRYRTSDLMADIVQLRGEDGLDATSVRGVRLIRGPLDKSSRKRLLLGESRGKQSYIVQDLSTGDVREYPHKEGHATSPPPDAISPAYFRPQVLDKYKADPDKYVLGPSDIECRGTWYLRSYDVNEAGQVYAYLKDLWSLPYVEQQYWRTFNELPKASITDRSYMQDFRAEAWLGPDPLRDLRETLRDFPLATHEDSLVQIWGHQPKDLQDMFSQLHYLHTESSKEWRDQVLQLNKVIVEGFKETPIRRVAQRLKCDDSKWRSLRLLRACLERLDISD